MRSAVAWKPNPGPQTAFLACPVREVLYGGAMGGGKTDGAVVKALKHIKLYGRHAKVLILRENFPQLSEIIDRGELLYPLEGGRYNKVNKVWRFPNGGRIIFGHLADGPAPYWGKEYTKIIIDEVTRSGLSLADYLKLLARLRSSHGVPCSVDLTSNPGGKGHDWVRARFMDPAPPLTVIKDPETGLERVFIPSGLADNPHLPEEYRRTLEQLPEAERNAYLYGDWNAFQGQIFNLVPGVHTWTWAQFKERTGHDGIPPDWTRFRAYDHGYARPGACLWIAVDPDGRAYVYREYYTIAKDQHGKPIPNEGAKIEPRKVAARIAELSANETYAASWTGPDLFYEVRGDQAGGVKVASHFQAEGLYFTAWRANAGSRLAGKQALHQRLAFEAAEDGSALTWPGLVIVGDAAPHLCRTLPALEYDPHDVELWDSDGEDHAPDALMGFAKMRPWAPPAKMKPADGWRERQNAVSQTWEW